MLTKRENLIEVMNGGNPDRFVNQYEALAFVMNTPIAAASKRAQYGGEAVQDAWGVTKIWPKGTPGAFPVHDQEHIVCKDITKWRDYVHAPNVVYPKEAWQPAAQTAASIDRSEQFVMSFVAPGVFEQCHYLLEIQNCLMNFYEEPEAMHELIDYITEYELALAEEVLSHVELDGVFHHDDWGSQTSTFISPAMFREFYLPSYKKIYGFYKAHGAKLIVHHSDSFAATLVPDMIEMGIDIWQGVMTTNNIPALIKQYGGKISFMGGIDSASIDREDWTPELVEKEARRACSECGKLYYIPSPSQGLPMSTFPGVYEATTAAIEKLNHEMF